MSNYFENFPIINYNGFVMRNIILKVKVIDDIKSDPYAFLPYTIKDGERAEDIAYYYYGSSEYVWAIWLANQMVDPYFDWPLNSKSLFNAIVAKYRPLALSSSGQTFMTDNEVFNWTMNETITDNILYYKNVNDNTLLINYDTYTNLDVSDKSNWISVRIFDYEYDKNEEKRNIKVINNTYIKLVDKNLKELLEI